jgi:hypothetical protein
VLGGLLGLVPGAGPFLTFGTLAAVLTGAAGGALGGGLLGAFVGYDIPEDEARFYETELHSGRALVVAKAGDRNAEALSILRGCGAYDATARPATPAV